MLPAAARRINGDPAPERGSSRAVSRTPEKRTRFPTAIAALALSVAGAAAAQGQPEAIAPPPPPEPSIAGIDSATADVLAAIHARYDGIATLRARFEQRYGHRLHQREDRWRGRLALRRPSKIRIDYDDPRGRLVVTDGTLLYAYDPQPAPGQYWEQPADLDAIPNALGLLSATTRLDVEFDARLLDTSASGFAGRVLELRPRRPTPYYERVLLYVDVSASRRGRVHRLMWIDAAGNTNRFDLREQDENPRIPDSTFAWTPPGNAIRIEP
jgi:outer membrane lipoprotein carrier protein